MGHKSSVKLRKFRQGSVLGFMALAGLAMGLAVAPAPAQASNAGAAAHQGVKSPKEAMGKTAVAADVDTTSSIQSGSEGACSTARRRLFVEGEGWIVRRVTTCY
jgi:hypothetical protein